MYAPRGTDYENQHPPPCIPARRGSREPAAPLPGGTEEGPPAPPAGVPGTPGPSGERPGLPGAAATSGEGAEDRRRLSPEGPWKGPRLPRPAYPAPPTPAGSERGGTHCEVSRVLLAERIQLLGYLILQLIFGPHLVKMENHLFFIF